MYHILIIEDDTDIRSELKLMLENALYQADSIEDFSHIPAQIDKLSPDLILLDIQLPGLDGLSLCRETRRTKNTPVIFVTSRSSSMDELNGIMMGGDDYITKPYVAPVLLARIAAVLKRSGSQNKASDSCILTCRGCELNLLNSTLTCKGKTAELTRNELRICWNLFSRCGEIVPREDIIDDLWDNQIFIDDNTLSVNITRIRSKLRKIGVDHLIETRRGQGYCI